MAIKKKAAPGGGPGTASSQDRDIIVAEINKSSREAYRVVRRRFNGFRLVDVRVSYDDPETGELRPGKSVSIKAELLARIIEALQAAQREVVS